MLEIYIGRNVALTASSRYNIIIDAMCDNDEIVYCDHRNRYYLRPCKHGAAYSLEEIQNAINAADTAESIYDSIGYDAITRIFEAACSSYDIIDRYLEAAYLIGMVDRHLRGCSSDAEDEVIKRLGILG